MALTFANQLTLLRILVVPFFISAVLYYSPEKDHLRFVALGIYLFAAITDVFDGYIARDRHEKTKAGAILDPLADKILLISAFICLYKVGVHFESVRFPIWLVVAVISRDVVLIFGTVVIHLVHGDFEIEPTLWGKATAFFQSACIIFMLIQWAHSPIIWIITFLLTLVSGIDYILRGMRILNNGA